ncbi:MAG TPA: HAMP domain-containing protein [Pseudomonadaceae bacterium]|nr:HAMP domain-containing protein [Pseudomonadaceae bacterium]
MRISIKYKLLLAMLSAHLLVYAAMYSVGYYNFQSGFIDYISRIEERQVPLLVKGLEDFYATTGSWDPLRRGGKFVELLRTSIESSYDPQIATRRSERINPTPIGFSSSDWYYTSEYSPARPYLHLLDAQQNILLGEERFFTQAANLNPIRVNGSVVGYLAVTSRQELSEQADLLFAEQQQNSFFVLAVFMVFISALIAFPVAIYLTRPVMRVVDATRALTNGDYGRRIPERGSDELSQLSADFNTLALTLDQNRTARQQWIADISHELRTPLAILQGELESIQDGIRPMNADTLDSLHIEVTHLNTLVNDLHELSLSDLGALVYQKEVVNLTEILEQSVDLHQQTLKRQNLRLTLRINSSRPDNALLISGDPSRLQQLFDNFLQNSCRYTDSGGEIHIQLREHGDRIELEWYDSAPGVNDTDIAHIFERLYRVEMSRNRAKGGSGLGLAICQNIVHAHDGIIEASHSPLGGLKLTLSFPALHASR